MSNRFFERLLLPAVIVLSLALGGVMTFGTSLIGTSGMGKPSTVGGGTTP